MTSHDRIARLGDFFNLIMGNYSPFPIPRLQLEFSRLEIWLTNALRIAPPMRTPSAGVNNGCQSLYHKSSPRGTPTEWPKTAIANHPKLRNTKNTSATKIRFSQLRSLSFIIIFCQKIFLKQRFQVFHPQLKHRLHELTRLVLLIEPRFRSTFTN